MLDPKNRRLSPICLDLTTGLQGAVLLKVGHFNGFSETAEHRAMMSRGLGTHGSDKLWGRLAFSTHEVLSRSYPKKLMET